MVLFCFTYSFLVYKIRVGRTRRSFWVEWLCFCGRGMLTASLSQPMGNALNMLFLPFTTGSSN